MLANMFLQIPALGGAVVDAVIVVFSRLLFDLSRIVHGGETNYVMATTGLYLNIYNLFISLLNILMAFSGNRD